MLVCFLIIGILLQAYNVLSRQSNQSIVNLQATLKVIVHNSDLSHEI